MIGPKNNLMRASVPGARGAKGFTLLELSIVLAVIAVVTGGGIAIFNASLQASQTNQTIARMQAIDQALINYGVSMTRIPCPANLTYAPSNTSYGVEASTPGTCASSGTPSVNFVSNTSGGKQVEGAVPTRTLRLPDSYMYDAWGRRFRYAVDPTYTASGTLPTKAGVCATPPPYPMTVNDASGAARSTKAIYVLLSHGQNGHGAYTLNGGSTPLNAGSTNTQEQANCYCGSTGAATSSTQFAPTFYQMLPTQSSTTQLNSFDDIVMYRENWEIQTQGISLTTGAGCIYAADGGNKRVLEYDTGGNYLMSFGSSYFGANGPYGLSSDSQGNIWVVDNSNNRVLKFNSSGTFLMGIGGMSSCSGTNCACTSCGSSSGSSAGALNQPNYIAFDSTGNIWVTDNGNYRVNEYSASGSYLGQLGVTGTPGNGSGKFQTPQGMAINGGYVYVADYTSNILQKFNASTYAYVGTFTGSPGFQHQQGVGLDPQGHVWVTDSMNDIQEFSTASNPGTYLAEITGAYGAAGGAMEGPNDIVFDGSGNMWVADQGGNRIVEFNSSGTWVQNIGGTSSPCSNCSCTVSTSCTNSAGSGNGQMSTANSVAYGGYSTR